MFSPPLSSITTLQHDDYTVAWVCPLQIELIAALEMLDEEHPRLPQQPSDHNVYNLGSISGQNIVIVSQWKPGNTAAATVIAQMRMTFPSIRFGLLVGIGGGVPTMTDTGMIRLGDVVVSKPTGIHSGAVQYDHGKAEIGLLKRTGVLAPPPAVLLHAAQDLAAKRARSRGGDPVAQNIGRIDTSLSELRKFKFPGAESDYLYPPEYVHREKGVACDKCQCDPAQRTPRDTDDGGGTESDIPAIVIHRGTIASGERVIKDGILRDRLAIQDEVLCFEMEAAGALADFPCLVIRGISDYCDSHKNDQWHGYAAAAAAAYARQIFFHLPIDQLKRFV